jgi:hypothetical protein
MAARNFVNGTKALQREVVKLWAKGVGAGAADLTGLESAGGGVESIEHDGSTGLYTVTLADKYAGLLQVGENVIDATSPDDWKVVVVAEDVAGAKTINIAVFKGGALTDLTTDDTLLLELTLKNTQQSV